MEKTLSLALAHQAFGKIVLQIQQVPIQMDVNPIMLYLQIQEHGFKMDG